MRVKCGEAPAAMLNYRDFNTPLYSAVMAPRTYLHVWVSLQVAVFFFGVLAALMKGKVCSGTPPRRLTEHRFGSTCLQGEVRFRYVVNLNASMCFDCTIHVQGDSNEW